ncbi:MAG: tyrosine-protein phosphatase, partial [Spirochaetaceae bacterium]
MNTNETNTTRAGGANGAGDGWIPPRLPIPKSYNIRDLGVYRSRDGRPLRADVFFRADNLGRLDADGTAKLLDLGVKTVIDLRTADEIRETPNPFERDRSVAFHSIDMVGDSHDIIARGDTIESVNRDERLPNGYFADPVGRIATIYKAMLDHQARRVHEIMTALAAETDGGALFHCMAGQDRTGIVAAFLLSIVDVSDDTIVADYTATAEYNVQRFVEENHGEYWKMKIETVDEYRSQFCPPGAMEETLEHLQKKYTGAVAYL